ncbi:glutaredoxin family protein [Heyndrickxia ginsengihumi]|uniref:glutaredoxin family protein n=1 Tax=Heyndrickxia ginsengihumi TaxID=363870 RepID=UPI00203B0BE9|nr:glutaredoxin family protein [Heyndrickxia ginsengihumi]MCM3024987.1 glutaredoxin family protein [Heyndrickxia ginsengihumi]
MAKMIVFFHPTCGPCHELKKWLNEKNIEYVSKDASESENYEEFQSKGFQFTPTSIIVDENNKEHIVIGFNKSKIEQLLS